MPQEKYWFPAKRYGWGWGPPTCWQGWVVVGIYAALIAAATYLRSNTTQLAFFAVVGCATLALIAICMAKGEPPRWRWGGDS